MIKSVEFRGAGGMTLKSCLEQLSMTKAEMARELGVKPNTVYRWKDADVPLYVWAWIRLKLMGC